MASKKRTAPKKRPAATKRTVARRVSPAKAPTSVEDYLAALSPDKRRALERLRKTILSVAPNAEERIGYGIPGFQLDGKWFIWIGAGAEHCAIYGVVGDFAKELKGYDVSGKGTIRFAPDDPLPDALVRRLVKERLARNAAR